MKALLNIFFNCPWLANAICKPWFILTDIITNLQIHKYCNFVDTYKILKLLDHFFKWRGRQTTSKIEALKIQQWLVGRKESCCKEEINSISYIKYLHIIGWHVISHIGLNQIIIITIWMLMRWEFKFKLTLKNTYSQY